MGKEVAEQDDGTDQDGLKNHEEPSPHLRSGYLFLLPGGGVSPQGEPIFQVDKKSAPGIANHLGRQEEAEQENEK